MTQQQNNNKTLLFKSNSCHFFANFSVNPYTFTSANPYTYIIKRKYFILGKSVIFFFFILGSIKNGQEICKENHNRLSSQKLIIKLGYFT